MRRLYEANGDAQKVERGRSGSVREGSGTGSVVVKPVLPGATVVGVPGRIVGQGREPLPILEHGRLPDPVDQMIRALLRKQERLRERLGRLEEMSSLTPPQGSRQQGRDGRAVVAPVR